MAEKLDIYSFIGSDVIREYMREYKVFSPLDKARIIIFSFRPVEEKIEALKTLADELNAENKDMVVAVYSLLSEALDTIYNPSSNQIFNITRGNMYWDEVKSNSYKSSIRNFVGRLYKSFDDFISEYEVTEEDKNSRSDINDSYHEELDYIYGEISSIDTIGKDYYEDISFEAAYFDGHIRIYHISVSEPWAKERGYSEEVADMIGVSSLSRYSLPFKHGDSVMLKTPFMTKPIYGGLYSSMDGGGCWYNFFYYDTGNGVDMIDISYHEIGFCDHLTVFDWLYRSDKKLTPTVKNKLVGKKYSEYSQCTKLDDIKEEGYADVFCTIKVLDIKERTIEVTLKDESGAIEGEMRVFAGDTKWIEKMEENGEKVYIGGHFIKHPDTGKMYMDYHCNVERLSENIARQLII